MNKHKELRALVKGLDKADRVGAHEYFVNRFGVDSVGPVEEYLPKRMRHRTLDQAKKSASHHATRSEWKSFDVASYLWAAKNKVLDECCAHMEGSRGKGHWKVKENVLTEAAKHNSKVEWQRACPGSFNAAVRYSYFEEATAHMTPTGARKPAGYWTKERCIADALQHETQSDWARASPGASGKASRSGWLAECCAHMAYRPGSRKSKRKRKLPHIYWTKERCQEDALNYQSRTKWRKGSGSAAAAATRNGWYEECCAHMPKRSKPESNCTSIAHAVTQSTD